MTEYTPTTEEVRDRWGRDAISEDLRPEWLAEFDRWLADHDRQVAERAWAEGFVQATDFMDDPALPTPLNPYRKVTDV